MDNYEINEDEINFKVINDGLGFHHSIKDEKEIELDLNDKSEILKYDLEMRSKNLLKQKIIKI